MVSPTVVFIAGMIIVLVLVLVAGLLAWKARTPERRFRSEMAIAALGAGILAGVVFLVTMAYITPDGPPDPRDLCPAGTYNRYPEGPAVCVNKSFWGD